MLKKINAVLKAEINHGFLNPFGDKYHYFSRFFLSSKAVKIIPRPILFKVVRSLKRLGNVKDAERIIINLFKDSSNKEEGLMWLIKIKSPIKSLSIIGERQPDVLIERYGFGTTYMFAKCLLKSGKLYLAKSIFERLYIEQPKNILIVRPLSWLNYYYRDYDRAYLLMSSVKKDKKFSSSDLLFSQRCRGNYKVLDEVSSNKVKYGI